MEVNKFFPPLRYIPARRTVIVGNEAATFVNFTLTMQDLAKWSQKLDFGITANLQTSYMTSHQIYAFLHSISLTFPHDTRLTTFGKSQRGSDIYSLEVSSGLDALGVGNQRVHVVLIGAINGDEPVGTEVLIRFVRHLVEGELILSDSGISMTLCGCFRKGTRSDHF